jgi:site-specific DNA recombinase
MDPGLVALRTAEVRAQLLQAEQQLRPPPEQRHLTEAEIAQLVGSIRDIVKTLRRSDAVSKAAVYRELGLRLTYAPE